MKILKKISSAFKKKASNFVNVQSLVDMGGKAIWGTRDYQTFAEDGYIKNVIAYRAVKLIAVGLSSVELRVYDCDAKGRHRILEHPLINLLKNPSKGVSINNFLENLTSYLLISGNAYILRISIGEGVEELHLLRPDRVRVMINSNRQITGYRNQVTLSEFVDYPVDPFSGESDILHLKNFHPLDDLYGLSSVEAASYSIDQHNQANFWNQSFLQNGARPSGALIVKNAGDGSTRNLSTTQYERIRDQIDELYTGAKSAGRPLLLEAGLEWKEMGTSHKDMDFVNMKNGAARDISAAIGVPPQLLSIPGDNTYTNLIEARLALWEQTIIPITEMIINNLNNWLAPQFGDDLCIDYDRDGIEALVIKRQKLWDFVQGSNFMTVNEKREIVGLGPIEGGDTLTNGGQK